MRHWLFTAFSKNYPNRPNKLQWYIHVYVWLFSPFWCGRNQSLLQNDCHFHLPFYMLVVRVLITALGTFSTIHSLFVRLPFFGVCAWICWACDRYMLTSWIFSYPVCFSLVDFDCKAAQDILWSISHKGTMLSGWFHYGCRVYILVMSHILLLSYTACRHHFTGMQYSTCLVSYFLRSYRPVIIID